MSFIFCSVRQSVCYYTSVAAVMKWFPGRAGLMGSVCIAGFGFGSVIWNPLETQFVNPDNIPPEDIPGDNSEDKWVTFQCNWVWKSGLCSSGTSLIPKYWIASLSCFCFWVASPLPWRLWQCPFCESPRRRKSWKLRSVRQFKPVRGSPQMMSSMTGGSQKVAWVWQWQ